MTDTRVVTVLPGQPPKVIMPVARPTQVVKPVAQPSRVIKVLGPSERNLVVGPDDPGLRVPGLWIQTFPDGGVTFWIEDGT